MAQTIIEHNDGRELQVGDGKVNYRQVYILSEFDAELDIVAVLGKNVSDGHGGTTAMPFIGQQHPILKSLYAWTYNLVRIPGASDMWRMEWEFRSVSPGVRRASPNTGGLTRGPSEIGFQEITANLTGSFALMYRADPVRDHPDGTDFDIGGDPLDVAGVPTSVMRPQYEITVARTSTKQFDDNLAKYGEEVGTRSTQNIFGLDGEYVLYKGAQIQRVETQVYRVVHTWVYDAFAHLIQVPKYNADGVSPKDEDGYTKHVYHKQPFRLGNSHKFLTAN